MGTNPSKNYNVVFHFLIFFNNVSIYKKTQHYLHTKSNPSKNNGIRFKKNLVSIFNCNVQRSISKHLILKMEKPWKVSLPSN